MPGLLECTVKSPYLVSKSKSLLPKALDMVEISDMLQLIIGQIGGR